MERPLAHWFIHILSLSLSLSPKLIRPLTHTHQPTNQQTMLRVVRSLATFGLIEFRSKMNRAEPNQFGVLVVVCRQMERHTEYIRHTQKKGQGRECTNWKQMTKIGFGVMLMGIEFDIEPN